MFLFNYLSKLFKYRNKQQSHTRRMKVCYLFTEILALTTVTDSPRTSIDFAQFSNFPKISIKFNKIDYKPLFFRVQTRNLKDTAPRVVCRDKTNNIYWCRIMRNAEEKDLE